MKVSEKYLQNIIQDGDRHGSDHLKLKHSEIIRYGELRAIEFAKWIADLEANEEQSDHIYGLTLIDGNYYWEGDEDGDQPLNEEDLYKMFSEENKTHKI